MERLRVDSRGASIYKRTKPKQENTMKTQETYWTVDTVTPSGQRQPNAERLATEAEAKELAKRYYKEQEKAIAEDAFTGSSFDFEATERYVQGGGRV